MPLSLWPAHDDLQACDPTSDPFLPVACLGKILFRGLRLDRADGQVIIPRRSPREWQASAVVPSNADRRRFVQSQSYQERLRPGLAAQREAKTWRRQDVHDCCRHLLISIKSWRDDYGLRAHASRPRHWHRASDPKGTSFIARSEHDCAIALRSDQHRPAPKGGIIKLLNRRIKLINIGVSDNAWPGANHVTSVVSEFAQARGRSQLACFRTLRVRVSLESPVLASERQRIRLCCRYELTGAGWPLSSPGEKCGDHGNSHLLKRRTASGCASWGRFFCDVDFGWPCDHRPHHWCPHASGIGAKKPRPLSNPTVSGPKLYNRRNVNGGSYDADEGYGRGGIPDARKR